MMFAYDNVLGLFLFVCPLIRYTSKWEHECIDVYEMVMTQGWIKDNVLEGSTILMQRIFVEVAMLPDDALHIDNLFIGSESDGCKFSGLLLLMGGEEGWECMRGFTVHDALSNESDGCKFYE